MEKLTAGFKNMSKIIGEILNPSVTDFADAMNKASERSLPFLKRMAALRKEGFSLKNALLTTVFEAERVDQ